MKSYETRIPSRRLSSRHYVWLAALALSACGGSEDVDVQGRNAQLAEGCVLNTDCTAPLVCAFRKCHAQCTATRDCDPGLLCVASDKPFHVCQLQSETRCAYNSQCSGSQVCGVDGKCREQCATEKDCLPGQKCAQATCAEPPELSGGKLPVASGASGAGGGPAGGACLYADDCAANEVCRGGQCMAECRSDRDCVSPKSCVDGRCRLPAPSDGSTPPKGYGEGCNLNSDCPAPLTCGSAGLCVYACVADIDCATACCQGHACVATAICGGSGGSGGAGGAGGSSGGAGAGAGGAGGGAGSAGGMSGNAGATAGGASGAGGAGGTVGGPCDVDKDGFKAAGGACGGNDCDDADAKTHPGAKELCDGVDNNCDGFVDENAWLTQGIKELAIAGSYPGADPYGSSPPGMVVLPTLPPRVFLSAGDQSPMGPRVVVQELDGNLDPQGAVIAVHASQYIYKTSLASDGTSLMVAASVWDSGGGTLRAASFAPGAAPTTLPVVATDTSQAARPAVAWTGTKYAIVWVDAHGGPERLYRTAAVPMQAFPPPVPVYADPTKQTTSYGAYPTAAVGVGGAGVAVLSRTSSVGALLTFDSAFSTIGIPSNGDLGLDVWPSAVARVGGDWLALGLLMTSQTTAIRIDATTGSVSATRALSPTAGFGDVLPLGNGGALMAWASSTDIRYAFVTADLGTGGQTDPSQYAPLPVNDLQAGPAAISAPVLARIDATHIAIVWQDGKLKAAILECSP